jgi:hypothetical protein
VVGNHLFPHSELSDYTPLYRWRFELTMQYTGSNYQALDIIKDSRTDIRTLRGLLLNAVCHARWQIMK